MSEETEQSSGGFGHGSGAMPGARAKNARATSRKLLRVMKPFRWYFFAAVLLAAISVVLGVLGPRLLGDATNEIVKGLVGANLPNGSTTQQAAEALRAKGQDSQADMLLQSGAVPGQGIQFDAMRNILLMVLMVYIGSALLSWGEGIFSSLFSSKLLYRLRQDVEEKLARLPLSYFDKQSRGEILSRTTNDIDNLGQVIQQQLVSLIYSIMNLVAIIVMMLTISPLLTLIALVTVPLAGLVTAFVVKRAQPQFAAQWASTGKLNSYIEEMFTGHSLVKVFGQQKRAEKEFADRNQDLYESSFKAQFISGLVQPIMMFVSNLGYVAIAVVGGLRVASGSMGIGDVQAFIQYSRQFNQPIGQLAQMTTFLQSALASAERVFELLDADEQEADPDAATAPRPSEIEGRVEFEHVAFSYDPSKPLITDMNLVAEPGKTVAIVGPTGAGKTTLVNLIMRFYEIDSGRITLDGVDTRKMNREVLRSQIGMVLQDTWLFGGSIRDNIGYGRAGASEGEIEKAAEASFADHFIRSLPEGYDTVIDEEASNISAGEKQLLTIARAFLSDPAILILDEATSSVDTRTELLLQQAMNKLRAGRTSFVIAHRLSTIRDADVIVVMEHGDIVEQGSHEQLMEVQGAYYRLYESQFAGAIEG